MRLLIKIYHAEYLVVNYKYVSERMQSFMVVIALSIVQVEFLSLVITLSSVWVVQ